MAYAETLPHPVLKFCRWFNTFCLFITLLVCFDVFILPYATHKEKILSREEIYFKSKSRYSDSYHTTQMDNVILITENFRYPYDKAQHFNPREADSVRLVTTRIFKIVRTAYLKSHGEEKELKQKAGMFGTLMFLPIAFGLVAVFGVAMRHNKEQLLNAVVVNIILAAILLWVYGYL